MTSNTAIYDLQKRIQILEGEKELALVDLKLQFKEVGIKLKPLAFIKNILNPAAIQPKIKDMLIDTAIALGTGFVSKKIVFGNTSNPIRSTIGNLFQSFVTGIVSKHPETIKGLGIKFFDLFISKEEKSEEENIPKQEEEFK